MTTVLDLQQLYESDYYEWLEAHIKLLKNRQLETIDYDNLIEELESVGKSDKARVESLLEQVIRHLLMYQYWTLERELNSNHWQAEIVNFRSQLRRYLTTNLRNHLAGVLDDIYQDAYDYVKAKTNLNNLPLQCAYNLEQLLDKAWLPTID